MATVYYLVGRNQLLVQFLNGMLGALTVLVIYAIAARLFGRAAARWAALFMAFFPQMVFWSAAMYKDPAILLCIAVCMYAVLRLRERLSAGMIVLFIVSELALMTLRFYVAYFVAFAGLATFLFTQRRGAVRSVLTYGLLMSLMFGALSLAVKRETLEQTGLIRESRPPSDHPSGPGDVGKLWIRTGTRRLNNSGGTSGVAFGLGLLAVCTLSVGDFGLRQALAMPETLVWYALMPAFVRGLAYAMRHRFSEILPILVFATTLTLAYAIMQGNVGTAYRQRTQISMFFFVFIGVGLVQRQRKGEAASAAMQQV